ncbi:MAG: hypothetical protein QNJ15_07370 [Erythrobacter sp.]|nr:hypothetical protein [Erythrobacter sp.]
MAHRVEPFSDVATYVASRTHGTSRMIILSHGSLEDLEGAVDAKDPLLLRTIGWDLALQCAAIRSSLRSGKLFTTTSPFEVGFDPFEGLDKEEIAELQSIMDGLGELEDAEGIPGIAARVTAFAQGTEDLLGWDEPLPVVRNPDGMFPALKMMREFEQIVSRYDLPQLLPESWTQPAHLSDRDQE